ncbi:MAG TPA: hypothetical protein DEH05_02470 [Propionibacteriaceae bacterium]|nr:hypothetical protein [Propionibacteriaceae bacterium]
MPSQYEIPSQYGVAATTWSSWMRPCREGSAARRFCIATQASGAFATRPLIGRSTCGVIWTDASSAAGTAAARDAARPAGAVACSVKSRRGANSQPRAASAWVAAPPGVESEARPRTLATDGIPASEISSRSAAYAVRNGC